MIYVTGKINKIKNTNETKEEKKNSKVLFNPLACPIFVLKSQLSSLKQWWNRTDNSKVDSRLFSFMF